MEIPNVCGLILARRTLSSNEDELFADSSTIFRPAGRYFLILPALGCFVGPAQMEGFAGFPLAPGLGPEFAGQVRENNHSHLVARVGWDGGMDSACLVVSLESYGSVILDERCVRLAGLAMVAKKPLFFPSVFQPLVLQHRLPRARA